MDLMSQQRVSFMKFVDDCAIYCIANRGLRYQPLETPGGFTVYFTNDYGEAVLRYHGANEENYRGCIRQRKKNEILTHEGLQAYMFDGIKKCFHETENMEGILKFCSLYTDTAINCCRYDRINLINQSIVATVNFVFDEYVRPLFHQANPFDVAGIWNDIRQAGINLVSRERAAVGN